MKKVGLLIIFLIVCVLAENYQYNGIIQHPIKTNQNIHVSVKNGDTLYSVLDHLSQIGVIKNSNIIKFYVKENQINSFNYGVGFNEKVRAINWVFSSLRINFESSI